MNSQSVDTQYTLSGGELLIEQDNTEIVVVLTNNDLNIIKARRIAQDNDTTFLVLSEFRICDLSLFLLPNIPVTNGLRAAIVNDYIPDETSPRLVNFTLNLSSETLELTFDETVEVMSINFTQYTLQNSSNSLQEFHTLYSDSSTDSESGPIISIRLSVRDLNEIKRLVNLGTQISNTFLSFTELAASDVAGNPVVSQSTNNSIQVLAVFSDTRRPTLEEYEFSLDQGLLTLTFSETVLANSVVVTDISLQNQPSFDVDNGTIVYNLTGGIVLSDDGPIISIALSQFDLNEIKHIQGLASGSNNRSTDTFLTIRSSGITDSNGNMVIEIQPSSSLPATRYFSDVTSPQLQNFNFDLNTGILTLIFNESVNGSTLQFEGVTLYNANATNSTSYSLTAGVITFVGQVFASFQLSDFDLNNIKAIDNLATYSNNTFIALDEGTVNDNNNNPVAEILPEMAIAITNLTSDRTPPQLLGYDLDLDSGNLTLTFSETVPVSSLQATGITLQSSASQDLISQNSSLFYTLMNSDNVKSIGNNVLVLEISNSDLNQVKRRSRLATSENNTYLSLSQDAVTDTSGNSVTLIPNTNATLVSNYTADISPPQLMSFNVDLNRGEITFRFSETVNNSTLQLSSFTLRDSCPSVIDFIGNFTNGSNFTNSTEYTLTGS